MFLWSVLLDLRCSFNFCCTAKWSSYTYTYIFFFFWYYFPSCSNPRDWTESPVLNSWTSLLIHSKCNSLHLPTPNSPSLPLPLPEHPWQPQACTLGPWSICFCFIDRIICAPFLTFWTLFFSCTKCRYWPSPHRALGQDGKNSGQGLVLNKCLGNINAFPCPSVM